MSFVGYKRVCPLPVLVPDEGSRPCGEDLYVTHTSGSEVEWWVRGDEHYDPDFGREVGDDWWKVECAAGHVIAVPLAPSGDDPEPFDPQLLDELGCPTLRSTGKYGDEWNLAT